MNENYTSIYRNKGEKHNCIKIIITNIEFYRCVYKYLEMDTFSYKFNEYALYVILYNIKRSDLF